MIFTNYIKLRYVYILIISIISIGFSSAQTGRIFGKISDASTNEMLIGAAVRVIKQQKAVTSDLDGNFTLDNLEEGEYAITVSYISYQTVKIENIEIKAGDDKKIDVKLKTFDKSLKAFEVISKTNRESENLLLLEQKKAILSTKAIGAKEMYRKGIGDAEAAVSNISGVSKQNGVKNLFVRGLGDRYNFTTLNGFPIPSEDPEYKNIALDFFGSNIISNIGVKKVYSSSEYSDVAGAVIDINSKKLSKNRELKLGISAGANSNTFKSIFLTQDGVKYFGITQKYETDRDLTPFKFENRLNPKISNMNISHNYGVSGGNRFFISEEKHPLSIYFVAGQKEEFFRTNEIVRNTTSTGEIYEEMKGEKYTKNSNQILLLNSTLELLKRYEFSYNFMLIHNTNQYIGDYNGTNSEKYQSADEFGSLGYLRRQQTNDNRLMINQLNSKWAISKKLNLNAGVAINSVLGSEPDRRVNNFSKYAENNRYTITAGTGNQQRYFSTLKERDIIAKLMLNYKISDNFNSEYSALKIGYNVRYVLDDFEAIEYDFTAPTDIVKIKNSQQIDLDKIYNTDNLNNKKFNIDRNRDTYYVTKLINSLILESTYQLTSKLIVNGGLKYDNIYLAIDYNVDRGGNIGEGKIYKPTLLPSLNLRYAIYNQQQLRFGISKTYTMPQSKEISPYKYVSLNFSSQGNRELKPSENYNLDIKWDWYITPSEILSITPFYKYIKSPIARVEEGNSGGYLTYKNISKYATIAGVELETKNNIFSNINGDKSNRLSVGINASYIYTNLKVDVLNTKQRNTKLEGASPLIVNMDISHYYSNNRFSLNNAIVLNYFSDRIYTIGTLSYNDIIEKGTPTLSLVSSLKMGKHFTLKFTAKNLLNPKYILSRYATNSSKNIELSRHKKGINIALKAIFTL